MLSSELSDDPAFMRAEAVVVAQEPSPLADENVATDSLPRQQPRRTHPHHRHANNHPTYARSDRHAYPHGDRYAQTRCPQADWDRPTPTDTPVPEVDFRLVKVRRLSACENHGNHNIYINVLDKDGNGLPFVKLWVSVGPDGTEIETGYKRKWVWATWISRCSKARTPSKC